MENYEALAMQTFVKENAIIPDSFKTAKQSNEWPAWRKAIFTELDSIIENGVFEMVPKASRDKTTGRLSTMRYILYYAVQRKIKPHQADFVTAYLNSKNSELARSLINEPEGYVVKLKKTLYGLKQAARGWYD